MNKQEIHDIIRLAREKYYDLDGYEEFMCMCVDNLTYDDIITRTVSKKVCDYIGLLIENQYTLNDYLETKGVSNEDMKKAKLKFWDDLLGEEE